MELKGKKIIFLNSGTISDAAIIGICDSRLLYLRDRKKGVDEIHIDFKHPLTNQIYKMLCRVYCSQEHDLYVGILQDDKERIRVEKIVQNLRDSGVDEAIIKKAIENK